MSAENHDPRDTGTVKPKTPPGPSVDADSTIREQYSEQRLVEAVSRWETNSSSDPSTIIGAACDALIAGLDSPALRELAGLPVDSRRGDVDSLVADSLDELGLPRLAQLEPGFQIGPGGNLTERPAVDDLRLAVVPLPGHRGGFEVQIFVNEVEITALGAGIGMDPYDVLIPENRFVATTTSHRIPLASCECGAHGCGGTDVTILRAGDAVHWQWHGEVPMQNGVTFRSSQYDAEVARAESDLAWETPDRTAGRLILQAADHDVLATNHLEFGWLANHHNDASLFCVCLTATGTHQVLLYTPWNSRTPEGLARDVVRTLAQSPDSWHAEWLSMKPGEPKPTIAGPHWHPHRRLDDTCPALLTAESRGPRSSARRAWGLRVAVTSSGVPWPPAGVFQMSAPVPARAAERRRSSTLRVTASGVSIRSPAAAP